MDLRCRYYIAALATSLSFASVAAPTLEDSEPLVVGRNADFSGPNSARVLESQAGADAYIQWVNSKGGINGRKLVLKTRDDANDPKKPVINARELVEREGALVLFMPNSTPSTLSVLKDYAESANIPILAPLAGPDSFHTPIRNVLFNLRAKYQAEIGEAIRYFTTVGQKRLAIIHTDDSFGKDGLIGYLAAVKAYGAQSVFEGSFDREKLDVRKHLPKLLELQGLPAKQRGDGPHDHRGPRAR
jgi:branched-chain amino acid transport system substrate-binding protein